MAGILDLLNPANIAGALPANFTTDLASNIALGAASTVVLSGLKSAAGQDAIDPLHLFHKDASGASISTTVGKSISAAAYAALPQADKDAIRAAGYNIV